MNSLNSSSVDAGAGTAISGAEREEEVETDAFGVGKTDAGTLATSVALGLIDTSIVVFGLEGAELLEWEYLEEPLVDLIRPTAASFLATF